MLEHRNSGENRRKRNHFFFFRKLTKGIKGFDLGQKNSKLSHACLPLTQGGYDFQFSPPVLFGS
jgi:hypothetical protein